MKKLFIIAILLVLSSCAFQIHEANASDDIIMGWGDSGSVNECLGLSICQNFETATTGYDNGETWTALGSGITPTYTTSPLRGTQSLYINDGTSYALSPSYTQTGEIWGHFVFQTSDGQPGNNATLLRWGDANLNNSYGAVSLLTTGYLKIIHGTGTATATTTQLPNGSTGTYHVWFHWKKGTGANGEMEAYISTSNTRPGTAEVSLTNGSITSNTVQTKLSIDNPGSSIKFDQLYISNSDTFSVVQP